MYTVRVSIFRPVVRHPQQDHCVIAASCEKKAVMTPFYYAISPPMRVVDTASTESM